MRSRGRLNLLLGALVLATGAAGLWLEERDSPPGQASLTPLEPRQVDRLSLYDHAADRAVTLVKAKGSWRLSEPFDHKANTVKVATLLALLTAPSVRRFGAANLELSVFGLAPPLAHIDVAGLQLAFGGTEPIDGRRYVLVDEEIHLIEDRASSLLPLHPALFVNLTPLADAQRVTGIRHGARFMRWQAPRWVSEGFGATGSDWFNRHAERWLNVQAIAVKPFSEQALWPDEVEFEIEAGGATLIRRFVMRKTEHEVILGIHAKGIQYHLLVRAAQPLLEPPQAYR